MFVSTKVFDGFSCCFRQWKATTTHCQYLHGYGVSFKVWFEGNLDERNWVWDFGGMKRAKTKIDGKSPKEWMEYMFDHTVLVAQDDPHLFEFQMLNRDPKFEGSTQDKGILQLRIVPATGAEKFAEFIYHKLNDFVKTETDGRVKVKQVEFREHGKNSAIYSE
jgi:6-pyruvoyltetrahydropterin/6-carboxytetrahydropterin synthase